MTIEELLALECLRCSTILEAAAPIVKFLGTVEGAVGRVAKDCADCQGTRRRYPTLARSCTHYWRLGAIAYCQGDDCERCNGTGWIPDCTVEKLLELLLNAGFQVQICKMDDGALRIDLWEVVDGVLMMRDKYRNYGDTLKDALVNALGATNEH